MQFRAEFVVLRLTFAIYIFTVLICIKSIVKKEFLVIRDSKKTNIDACKSGIPSELWVRFCTNKTSLSHPVVFVLIIPRRFFCCNSLFVCGFICGVCSVLICSSSLLLLVPREGWCCWTRIRPAFANSVDPDQLASKKPADLDLHYLPFSMWLCFDNLVQVVWLAENLKWA